MKTDLERSHFDVEQKGYNEANGYAGVLLLHALDMRLEGAAEARRHRFIRSVLQWVFEEAEYIEDA